MRSTNKTKKVHFITTEILVSRQVKVPVITEVYDPLSGKYDETITPQAPIVVLGRHLALLGWGVTRLCLVRVVDFSRVFEIPCIYRFSESKVIVSLPVLSPGEYSPAVRIVKEGCEDEMYVFPVLWVVMPEGHEREREKRRR